MPAGTKIIAGSLCWFRDLDGSAKKVEVVDVDRSIIPPSYEILVDGKRPWRLIDTEQSTTMITSFEPVAALRYHGRARGS